MSARGRIGILMAAGWVLCQAPVRAAENDWIDAARRTHTRFTGQKGTLAQIGDSITFSRAFWAPLQTLPAGAPAALRKAHESARARMQPDAWQSGKGPEIGNDGGKTTAWARERIDDWLKRLNPEVAVILLGSNDLGSLETPEYRQNLHALVQKCQENGTVALLTTIPPRHGFEQKTAAFAAAAREVARELQTPLIDFHAEVLKRRPDDWDGALAKFDAFRDYDVPTLLARDGVHPSFPARYQNDYSAEGLRCSGYTLRNYLTLLAYAEAIAALDAPPGSLRVPPAPPLPPPAGDIVRITTGDALRAACAQAKPGQTLLMADGHYPLADFIEIKADNVTLRGESGHPERVVLDGGGTLGELLKVTACSGVTLADFTVQNVRWNGIKINSETGVQRLRIYHCILHNIWQRAVKGVMVPEKDREMRRPADFRIEYCLFYNDHAKRFEDDPADTAATFGGDYIGGIDAMYPRRWTISDNVFVGIQGRRRQARGAIFLWHDARDGLIERNVFIDCDSGICLGNSSLPAGVTVHATGFLVRNNFVLRARENGILADYTRDCKIIHNTVYEPGSELGRLIRIVHDNDGLLVANNLLAGPAPRNESASAIRFVNNRDSVPASSFVAPDDGDLRLTAQAAGAIDQASPLPDVPEDIDRNARGPKPDLGAHEYGAGDIPVSDAESFRRAVQAARPGSRIRIAAGTYRGAFYFSNLHGAPGRPIVLAAADPKNPPVFVGAGECLHFSKVSYLELQDLVLRGASDNGLNIDDGGAYTQPSHHVLLRGLRVSDIGPTGNHDGIKLSGLDGFTIENCVVERWGGSAIDMVGCHQGRIVGCTFRQGGSSAIQAKGGSSELQIEGCRFENYGARGVNIGGSTGLAFFRPPVATMPADGKYEARALRIEGNLFVGGETPVAFVGVDGALVRRNTIYHPQRWALRILQETTEPGFVPSRHGVFEENIVVFRAAWAEGGVNIGAGTAPQTFRFARNVWFCDDRPERSRPTLPTPETGALVGKDPLLRDPARGDFSLHAGSPAAGRGGGR